MKPAPKCSLSCYPHSHAKFKIVAAAKVCALRVPVLVWSAFTAVACCYTYGLPLCCSFIPASYQLHTSHIPVSCHFASLLLPRITMTMNYTNTARWRKWLNSCCCFLWSFLLRRPQHLWPVCWSLACRFVLLGVLVKSMKVARSQHVSHFHNFPF